MDNRTSNPIATIGAVVVVAITLGIVTSRAKPVAAPIIPAPISHHYAFVKGAPSYRVTGAGDYDGLYCPQGTDANDRKTYAKDAKHFLIDNLSPPWKLTASPSATSKNYVNEGFRVIKLSRITKPHSQSPRRYLSR